MVWKVLIAAVVFVGLCVVGLCFNVIFRKNGRFPETDVGRNPEMRKRGIVCAAEEDEALHRAPKAPVFDCGDCTACDLYKLYSKKSEKK